MEGYSRNLLPKVVMNIVNADNIIIGIYGWIVLGYSIIAAYLLLSRILLKAKLNREFKKRDCQLDSVDT